MFYEFGTAKRTKGIYNKHIKSAPFGRPTIASSRGLCERNILNNIWRNNMHIKKTSIILSVFVLTLFSFNAPASNLIRFYTNHDSYQLVPPGRITNIYIDVEDNEIEIYIDGDKSVLWKITLENNPEDEALKLVEAIYSVTRKEILNVKVNSFN